MCFDQYEFESYEAEEFLAIATESKSLRGSRINNIGDFYKKTEWHKEFKQWQSNQFNTEKYGRLTDLENQTIAQDCKELCGITISKETKLYIHHNEWNLQDLLWEDEKCYYRVVWCTTA